MTDEHQPGLFEDLRGMVHRGDPMTCFESAAVIKRKANQLHEQVSKAFAVHGAMTDEELEQLPEFRGYGPSTIRKRRSELYQAHRLRCVSYRNNSRGRRMVVWAINRESTEGEET